MTTAGRSAAWWLVAAAAVFATGAVFIVTGAGGHDVVRTVDDLAQGAAAVIGSAVALCASRRHSGRSRRGWAVMALGLAMWAAGQTVWCWYEIVEGRAAPFPSPADIGFLSFSICATVAVCLIADDGHAVGGVRRVIDGLIVAGGLLVISWTTALGVTVQATGGFGLPLVVSLAYPVSDIVLLTMTLQMLARAPGARRSLMTLGAATMALALADSSYTYLSAKGQYHTGDLVDLGWIGGFGLIAVAAAMAQPRRVSAIRAVASRHLVFLPYAVLVIAGVVVGSLLASGDQVDTFEGVVATVVVVLVLARQYLTVRENHELMRTVEAREAQLSHQAFHDDLTGLPNRALFNDRVGHALELHRRQGRPLAVLFCDLDDFKVINDTLGHRAGDSLLVRVAERLRGAVRAGDSLSRLGGDEFAVLVEGSDPGELADRIINLLREPFDLDGRLTTVRASIGISSVAADEATPSAGQLLAHADTAMYAVKRSGKGARLAYNAGLRLTGIDDLDLHQALSEALAAGDVYPVFQPIVDPRTGRVRLLETLARWDRNGAAVAPGVFVALAERLGLVADLTDRMLEAGVAQLARWSAMLGHHDLRVSVNVSALELTTEARLAARVAAVLSRHAVSSDQLVIEITESAVAADDQLAGNVLGQLRQLGVHVALDDFGVGQSSFARLRQYPVDYLKLDGAMIRRIDEDEAQSLIVNSIIDIGRQLNVQVIAESVETVGQLRLLQASPAPPLLQGYALARPAPAAALTSILVRGVDLALPAAV